MCSDGGRIRGQDLPTSAMIFVVENAAIRFADGVDTSPPGISSFHFVFVPFPVSSPRRKERGRKEGRYEGGSQAFRVRGVEIAPSVRSGVSSGGGIVRIRGMEGLLFFFIGHKYLFVHLFTLFLSYFRIERIKNYSREERNSRGWDL